MIYRFVQLSDIHFGQEKDGSLPEHDDVRQELLKDVGEIAEKRGAANLIVVVGDVAFAGKVEEYARAGIWLDNLANAVGCSEESVRLVPGNHDCDRSRVSTICSMVHDTIRGGTPKSAHANLEKIAKDADGTNPTPSPLLNKLEAYRDFAASYGCDFKSAAAPMWTYDIDFGKGIILRLFGLNSVQVCDDKDDAGKMILGNTQYVFPAETNVVPIVLVHHPLKWFLDQTEAEQYLHNRAYVIMVGHEHIPRFSKVSTGVHDRIDLSSGATNPPERGGLYKHTYNWIEMSLVEGADGKCSIRVEVIARTWSPETTHFVADRPRMNDGESIVFDIQCPRLKSRKEETVSVVSAGRALEKSGNESTKHSVEDFSKGGGIMQPSDDDVAQLRFLFWRHLDWRQRLKALVEADVLPPSAEKPIPQTLERLAIDRAKEEGKLAALWDIILPMLPPEKRHPNPFRKS